MSYRSLAAMTDSQSLRRRLIACAAQEGIHMPDNWVLTNLWRLVSGADWVAAWAYAEDTYNPNVNPDTGARTDVINDGMILSAVQSVASTNE